MKIKISKAQWEEMGKKAQWMPRPQSLDSLIQELRTFSSNSHNLIEKLNPAQKPDEATLTNLSNNIKNILITIDRIRKSKSTTQ